MNWAGARLQIPKVDGTRVLWSRLHLSKILKTAGIDSFLYNPARQRDKPANQPASRRKTRQEDQETISIRRFVSQTDNKTGQQQNEQVGRQLATDICVWPFGKIMRAESSGIFFLDFTCSHNSLNQSFTKYGRCITAIIQVLAGPSQ